MSKKANKATRSQPPRRSPESAPGWPAGLEGPDMSGNDREIEILRPTPRRQALLPVVALSASIAQAARDTGVSERTQENSETSLRPYVAPAKHISPIQTVS